jgi:hypothetical protein
MISSPMEEREEEDGWEEISTHDSAVVSISFITSRDRDKPSFLNRCGTPALRAICSDGRVLALLVLRAMSVFCRPWSCEAMMMGR